MTSGNNGIKFSVNKNDSINPPHIWKLKNILMNNHDSKKKLQIQ